MGACRPPFGTRATQLPAVGAATRCTIFRTVLLGHMRTKQVAPRSSNWVTLTAEQKLLSAVRDGDLASIRDLLAGGIPVNVIVDHVTPLLQAVRDDNREVVMVLIEGGANVNIGLSAPKSGVIAVDMGDTPLLAACYNGNADMAQELIRAGADVQHGTEPGTPLSVVMNQLDDDFLDPIESDRLRKLQQLLQTQPGAYAQPLLCTRLWQQPCVRPMAGAESTIGHNSSRKRKRGGPKGPRSGGLGSSPGSSSQGTLTLHAASVPAAPMSRADRLAARQARAAINEA